MWKHLSDAGMIDVIEGSADASARAHLDACERCRIQVQDIRQAWGWTERAAVPAPPPSYWDVLRRRIALSLADAPASRPHRPFWAAAATAGAALAVLVAVLPGHGPLVAPAAPPASRALPAWSALPPAEEDPALPLLEQVAPAAAAAAPAVECSGLAECVAGLSDDESRALAHELRQQLGMGSDL